MTKREVLKHDRTNCWDVVIQYSNGDKERLSHGMFHCLDGPAIEHANGYKVWYLNGLQYNTQEEHALAVFWLMNNHVAIECDDG
jgi:hypothetical protein